MRRAFFMIRDNRGMIYYGHMKQFYLTEIITKDNHVHQGLYFQPSRKNKKAILWVHGLTGRFYGDPLLMNVFADACEEHGWGFASFNNRGHDVIANIRKIDRRKRADFTHAMCGAGLEKFEDCLWDIDAGIAFLIEKGFDQVILIGHSTGANKVCFYAGMKRDPRVVGVVLAGPTSDRFSRNTDKSNYQSNLSFMKKLMMQGKGNEIVSGRHFFPMTPRRWLSLLAPNTKEDVFNYGDNLNVLQTFGQIKKPLLVILSELDETADRPMLNIKDIFDDHTKSKNYNSIIIPGTTHSYTGKEKEFVGIVIDWIKQIV